MAKTVEKQPRAQLFVVILNSFFFGNKIGFSKKKIHTLQVLKVVGWQVLLTFCSIYDVVFNLLP